MTMVTVDMECTCVHCGKRIYLLVLWHHTESGERRCTPDMAALIPVDDSYPPEQQDYDTKYASVVVRNKPVGIGDIPIHMVYDTAP